MNTLTNNPFVVSSNDTATTQIYPLSLHDALPISETAEAASIHCGRAATCQPESSTSKAPVSGLAPRRATDWTSSGSRWARSEEHTSELQSRLHLVCRLLLEKKKQNEQQHRDENAQ